LLHTNETGPQGGLPPADPLDSETIPRSDTIPNPLKIRKLDYLPTDLKSKDPNGLKNRISN